jgi:hypothetical protein
MLKLIYGLLAPEFVNRLPNAALGFRLVCHIHVTFALRKRLEESSLQNLANREFYSLFLS